jgi:hypothetical protein
MTEEEKAGLGIAFNEATLLGAEVARAKRMAAITLSVLSLAEGSAPPPSDARVQVVLGSVGRVVASLREGHWDDLQARVVQFPLEELLSVVQSFGGQPIYGWEFFDIEKAFSTWKKRLSFDERLGDDGLASRHSVTLFQEGDKRHLDLRIWFDEIAFYRQDCQRLDIRDVISGGQRWWDALHRGDQRTVGSGISPLGSS